MKSTMVGLFYFLIISCSQSISSDNPEWIEDLIVQFKNEAVGNPPQSIWRYNFNDQTVYYVPPQCCDQYSTLYDENENVLGAPDGGITGNEMVKSQISLQIELMKN